MAPLEVAATTTHRVEAAGRMPSMEWEPKTLTLDQIKFARVSTHICTVEHAAAYALFIIYIMEST